MIARARLRRDPPSRAFALGAVIAAALLAGFSALSAAQSPAASETTPATADAPPPLLRTIALVLPLESEKFARAADAVKAGFLAAADAAQSKPLVIGHGDGDGAVGAAFAKAAEAGARVIVGPLVRDDLKKVVEVAAELPPIIALNQLDDSAPLPANMYALALTIDGDARQLVRRARADGAQSVVVIASDAPLQQRFASAFNAEWLLSGGGEPSLIRFERAPGALALLKRSLGKSPPDAAMLALDPADAALVKPYLGTIAAYAGSQINDRQPREVRRDLDDLRFVEIPWLAEPDSPAFAGYARPQYPNATLDRLYALGIDAFRVAQAFENGPVARLELDGATGHISLDASRQFVREGRLLRFRAGEIVPVDAR